MQFCFAWLMRGGTGNEFREWNIGRLGPVFYDARYLHLQGVVKNQGPADRLVRRDIAEVFSDCRRCQDDFVWRRQRRGRISSQPAVLKDAEILGARDNRGRQLSPRDAVVKLAMWIVAAGYRNFCRIQHIGCQRLDARQLTGGRRPQIEG